MFPPFSKASARLVLVFEVLLLFALIGDAQNVRNTDYSPDKTLRSNARVNPSTLAIELSVPLGAYAGRRGNPIPITFENGSTSALARMSETVCDPTGSTDPAYFSSLVPDPSGVNGSSTAFTASTTYDLATGLPLTATDANGRAAQKSQVPRVPSPRSPKSQKSQVPSPKSRGSRIKIEIGCNRRVVCGV